MPMWEEICGSCGAKQAPLIDQRRHAMAARQAEAEGLLGDFEFDRATAIVERLRDEPHPQLRHLAHWAETFLHQIVASRDEQMQHAVESIAEAEKHEAAFDYLSAVFALETIPDPIRAITVPGKVETPARMLDRIKSKQSECRRLEAHIRSRLAEKSFDDLLPDVEKFLAVRPDRTDIQKIRTQLVERTRKRSAALEQAVTKAQKLASSGEYEPAHAVLSAFPAAALSDDGRGLLGALTAKVQRINNLKTAIQSRVRAKELSGLLDVVREYLALKPADTDAAGLQANLIARDQQIDATMAKLRGEAEVLWQSCRFNEAAELFTKIRSLGASMADTVPCEIEDRRIASCNTLWHQRQSAFAELLEPTWKDDVLVQHEGRTYEHSLQSGHLQDLEFDDRVRHVKNQRTREHKTSETQRAMQSRARLLVKVISSAAIAGLAFLVFELLSYSEALPGWLLFVLCMVAPYILIKFSLKMLLG
jgi:hypothetical protein